MLKIRIQFLTSQSKKLKALQRFKIKVMSDDAISGLLTSGNQNHLLVYRTF